ncbi:MAG TPA: hypothetical protein VET84_08630 [Stellaceae bacterium]|nr:hypothetical protein [Stellaceae bacterium]
MGSGASVEHENGTRRLSGAKDLERRLCDNLRRRWQPHFQAPASPSQSPAEPSRSMQLRLIRAMKSKDAAMVTREVRRMRRTAKGLPRGEVRKAFIAAAGKLEKIARRLESETARPKRKK